MDVTQQSLQPILDEIGIRNADGTAKTVRQLSQAEKQILRYIAVLRQSGQAHGDWANTIEAPANQLKIMKNQLVEASRAFANLFIGTFGKILPYANGLLMVIKEVSNAVAGMFGIEISDYNTGIADMGDAFVDIEDGATGAGNAVKELRRQTLGFDQINNLTDSTNSGSGSVGSTIGGGIDQRLIDSITSYDNGMESIRMKATDIRDKIMQWLGFTKEIDPLTGKVSFSLNDGKTNFEKIVTLSKVLVGLGLAKKVYDFASAFVFLDKKNGILLKGISGGTKAWATQNKTLTKSVGIIALVAAGWSSFTKQYTQNTKFRKSVDRMFDSINQFKWSLDSLIGYMSKFAGSIETIIDNVVSNFTYRMTTPITIFSQLLKLDFVGALDTAGGAIENFLENTVETGVALVNLLPFVHIETEAERFAKKMEMIQEAFSKNGGTSIKDYKDSLDKLLSSMTSSIPDIEKYNEIIEREKNNYDNAKESLTLLITQMGTDAYKISADDISRVNSLLDQMCESARNSGQAMVDSTTSIVNHLLEQKRVNEETAMSVIELAQAEAQAKNDSAEQYRLAMIKLTKQYESGEISASKFKAEQEKLKSEFFKATDVVDQNKNSIKNYVDYINSSNLISTKSFDELKNSISGIGDTTQKNIELAEKRYKLGKDVLEQLQLNTQQTIEAQNRELENLKRTKGEESQEYQEAKERLQEYQSNYNNLSKTILELNGERSDSIKGLKTTTVEALLGIVSSLQTSGYSMEKDSEGIVREVNKAFKKLGLKDELNLDSNMNDLINILNDKLGLKIPGIVGGINQQLSGIGAGVGFNLYNNGETLGKEFSSGLSNNLKVNGSSLYSSWNSVMSKFDKNFSGNNALGLQNPFTPFKVKNVFPYADGGYPSFGEMFIAREKGPELVGRIGNRSAVINNNQIIDGVKAGVYEAVATALSQVDFGGGQDIRVYAEEGIIVEKAVRGIQQHVAQTGELPFAVPV